MKEDEIIPMIHSYAEEERSIRNAAAGTKITFSFSELSPMKRDYIDLDNADAKYARKSWHLDNKLAIKDQKLAIHKEKLAIDSEKLTFEKLKVAFENQNYTEPTKNNILKVYKEIEINQVFGAPEIEKILICSTSTAKNVMKKLREMKVVKEVKGKGKGKYIFINKS